MTKRKIQKTGKSPYQRYQKVPYKYLHKECGHAAKYKHEVKAPTGQVWSGTACSRCHIILHAG